jgi:hypothetical protein
MLTQVNSDASYKLDVRFDFNLPGTKPSNSSKQEQALKRALTPLQPTFDIYGWLSITGGTQTLIQFSQIARKLAADHTAYIGLASVHQIEKPLSKLKLEDWVVFNSSDGFYIGHNFLTTRAVRLPSNRHFIGGGTGISKTALKWLQTHLPAGYQTFPLIDLSPVVSREWFLLAPDQFLGPGLDHPWRAPEDNSLKEEHDIDFPPEPTGYPNCTMGVPPDNDYPVDQKRLHKFVDAKSEIRITDQILLELARVTLPRTLGLSGPRTFLRSQLPKNTDIAWFFSRPYPVLAVKARIASALTSAGLLTPEMLTSVDVVDQTPPGCTPLPNNACPEQAPLAKRNDELKSAPKPPNKIKTPTLDDVARALKQFSALTDQESDGHLTSRTAGLPELWTKLTQIPSAYPLIALFKQSPEQFKGKITNPQILPAHSSMIEVAGDGSGDVILLLVPPGRTTGFPALLNSFNPFTSTGPWIDCAVARHDHEINEIVSVWPSIINFALDQIAENRLKHENQDS